MQKAKKYFETHPQVDVFYFTSDGLAFTDKGVAQSHENDLGGKGKVETITRKEYKEALEKETQAKKTAEEKAKKDAEKKAADEKAKKEAEAKKAADEKAKKEAEANKGKEDKPENTDK